MKKTHFWIALMVMVAVLVCVSYATAVPESGEKDVVSTEHHEAVPLLYIPERDDATVSLDEVEVKPENSVQDYIRDDIVSDGVFLSHELQELMLVYSEEYKVPYAALLAIAEIETHFDPVAVSSTSDYGLMQINKCNHNWLLDIGIDPMTYAGNIEAGAYIISQNLQKYEELELALMAYNCGPTGAKKLWDAGIYQTDYSEKVMVAFRYWSGILED